MATKPSSYQPPPTAWHAAVQIGDKVYRWGGKGSEQRRNVVDVFDIKKEQWECLPTRGSPPPGIVDCAYTALGSSLFTFGGDDGRSLHNSIHQLDTKTMEWRELVPRNPSAAPKKKRGCGMVSFNEDKLVVFAGLAEDRKSTDEFHVFDTKDMTWASRYTGGTKPPPISHFTFTKIDAARAVVFGGDDGKKRYNDVFLLDMIIWQWNRLDVRGAKVSVRAYHAACCLVGPLTGQEDPLVVVVGGMGKGHTVLNEVLLLGIDEYRRWDQIDIPEAILPRFGHTAVFGDNPDCRQLMLWGGRKIWGGSPIGETTLLTLWMDSSTETRLTRAEWKVTSVVKEHQLGNPEERLRKRMERLLPQSTETAAEEERGEEPAKQREELLKKTSASSQSDSTVPQKVDMKPKMFELKFKYKILDRLQGEWSDLAYALCFHTTTVKAIKREAADRNEAVLSVLSRWLGGEGEREPRTWATLLEALTDMGDSRLAQEIGKKLK